MSKGYISQILNGKFNFTLKKLIEISLAIGVIPQIKYRKITDFIEEDVNNKGKSEASKDNVMHNIFKLPESQDVAVGH